MINPDPTLQADVAAISSIKAVPAILEVICRTTGMGFAAVARVTDEHWVACCVRDEINFGLEAGDELALRTTICHEIRQSGKAVVIDDVTTDPVFCSHHTPAMYGFKSYISVPVIRKDGSFFGTLCAIDPKPAMLSKPGITEMFSLYADLISFHLNSIEQLAFAEEKLREERRNTEIREQFIAILGHDLRNPLSAVTNSGQLLLKTSADERTTKLATIIMNSGLRMAGLIENILDFARGRLGGGIILDAAPNDNLQAMLEQVITEQQAVWPGRVIETRFELAEPVFCDGRRMQQLLSNLLNNALTHGAAGTPVKVHAATRSGELILSVSNKGRPIPAAARAKLFQPFSRGEIRPGRQGLGLGLYIVKQIADAHEGKMEVSSTDKGTTFTLKIPGRSS